MWLDKIPALVDTIKKSARVLFVACGILLFLPQDYLAVIGLDNLVAVYKSWIGLLLLVSFLFVLGDAFNWVTKQYSIRKKYSSWKKRLHNLTPEEKIILLGYIDGNTRTQTLDYKSGVVMGLVHEKIIYQASVVGELFTGFDYNIQPWAWEYLSENRQLLK